MRDTAARRATAATLTGAFSRRRRLIASWMRSSAALGAAAPGCERCRGAGFGSFGVGGHAQSSSAWLSLSRWVFVPVAARSVARKAVAQTRWK